MGQETASSENQEAKSDAKTAEESKETAKTAETGAQPAEDFKNKYYYLAADMDNMRKRFEREKENMLKYGNERLLAQLLNIIDNLDRTILAVEKETDAKIKNIYTGVSMVRKMFLDVLGQNGLSAIETSGKVFDPNFHDAIAHQAVEGKANNEIVSEHQKGYLLNGRLLRASKVVVVKNEEKRAEQ